MISRPSTGTHPTGPVVTNPLQRQWPPGLSVSSSQPAIQSSSMTGSSPPASADSVPWSLRQLPAGITVQRTANTAPKSPDSVRLDDDEEDEDQILEDEEDYKNDEEEEDQILEDEEDYKNEEEDGDEVEEDMVDEDDMEEESYPEELPEVVAEEEEGDVREEPEILDTGSAADNSSSHPPYLSGENTAEFQLAATAGGESAEPSVTGDDSTAEEPTETTGQPITDSADEDVMMMDLGEILLR